MRLWDTGVQLYANLYYATDETIQKHPDVLAAFLRAAAKGWAYTQQNPEKAVDPLVKAHPERTGKELEGIRPVIGFSFTKTTAAKGWGTMEPSVWERPAPTLRGARSVQGPRAEGERVMTESILQATAAARPKIG